MNTPDGTTGQGPAHRSGRRAPWSFVVRSMIGQMALLTLLLFAAGVYVLAIRPIETILAPTATDPLDLSAQKVSETINETLRALDRDPEAPVPAAFRKVMDDAGRNNPQFRYYLRVGAREIGNGTVKPAHFHQIGIDRLAATQASLAAPEMCSQMFRNLGQGAGSQRVIGQLEYVNCGTVRYYEFDGLAHAFPVDIDRRAQAYGKLFWTNSSSFVLTVSGAFLLAVAVIGTNMVLIRRVARVAYSFDPTELDHNLPEQGLPQEVLPLVRATNHLIGRLGEMQQRQKFFLSAAAHELRTPLTVLRTRLELMDDSPIKDKLIGDARRMVGLVNQLLALMKIGAIREVRGQVDLVAVVRKVLADLATLAGQRDIHIYFEPQIARFACAGEGELLETAITNLIDNALSFTPAGGRLFVGLDVDGVVSVRDFGPGIDPATAETLFEPFVRYRANRKGYGLGLAIVKAVATLHGGSVAARNAGDGQGAIFTLQVPPQRR